MHTVIETGTSTTRHRGEIVKVSYSLEITQTPHLVHWVDAVSMWLDKLTGHKFCRFFAGVDIWVWRRTTFAFTTIGEDAFHSLRRQLERR